MGISITAHISLCFRSTAPCQNVLDYFRSVLEFHNQLVQPMAEEQLTEVRYSPRSSPVDSCTVVRVTCQCGLNITLPPQEEERQTVFEVCVFTH